MKPFRGNIEKLTEENENFRKVLFTGKHSQLVVMSLNADEEIGMEVHPKVDQFIRIESGKVKFILNGEESKGGDGDAVVIPAGTNHNVINTGDGKLKLYTIYSPANHPEGTIHATKKQADEYEASHH
ncbi:MAG: cupin domain-containing protein [bacterium]|nr:cupin domain-containing protein [bacterium]